MASLSTRIEKNLYDIKDQESSIVISGGGTPKVLYERLSRSSLDWSKTTLVLSDERWVPLMDSRRNEKMVRDVWLNKVQNPPAICSLVTDSDCFIKDEMVLVEERVKQLPVPFRWVILGMGLDGHTASLFPRKELPAEGLCCSVYLEESSEYRISLTPSILLNSDRVVVLISGEDKYRVYQESLQLLDNTKNGSTSSGLISNGAENIPISFLWQQKKTPVEIYVC